MSAIDEDPRDARQLAVLEAIDATLAGEPVDPQQAEMAELAVLLADERPDIDSDFAAALDRAVDRRFAPLPSEQPRVGPARRRRWWLWAPAAGLSAALAAAIVVVAAGGSGRPPISSASSSATNVPRALMAPTSAPSRTSSAAGSYSAAASSSSGQALGSYSAAASPSSGQALGSYSAPPSSSSGQALQPPANGRKIIQGAQLALATAPARLEAVAQEVFDVVGQFQGIVNSSNVTATSGPGGTAQFQLSLPSSLLPQAMASLSSLRYARVASRTDTSQDVNNQYEADVRALADARALRTSLLRQLANATTQAQLESLTAQIHDAEASISSDEATVRSLDHQIDFSQVGVSINGAVVGPVAAQSGGFGLGKAAHDAGRVLTVAAGIALIGVAALVPLGLVAALIWWVANLTRRRRREHALDLV